MAKRPMQKVNRNARFVSGSLAYDYDYLEREQRRREERERREYAERRMREAKPQPRTQVRRRIVEQVRHREQIHVSPVIILGFMILAGLVITLLMSYAQLATISHHIVREQKRLTSLQEEHVKLVAKYERTFDLAAIKEAAESAGMAKPSASQIYYVDLSEPDNVVLYDRANTGTLARVATAMGEDAAAVVEYFK